MDTVVYWIGTLFKLLLFLIVLRLGVWGLFWLIEQLMGVVVTVSGWRLRGFETLIVKTANFELQLSKLYISVRWFDSSCRHFFRVNIAGVHVQYYKSDSDNKNKPDSAKKKEGSSWKSWWRGSSRKKKKKSVDTGHSRKTRFLYWCLTRVLKLFELSIHCLEVWLQDSPSPNLLFITAVQVQGQFNAIAKPLPNKQLAVSLEVEKACTQFLLQTDRPCSTTVDGLYPLAEVTLSTKIYLFLKPLERREPLHFVQVNTVPLTISILHEDAVPYAVEYIRSLLSKSTATVKSSKKSEVAHSMKKTRYFPEKTEVVLEDVNLRYHSNINNRVLSSKFTRVSLAASLSRLSDSDSANSQDSGRLPGFNITVGLQDMSITDSVGHKSVKLHQMRLISESSSESLSNRLHVDSLHLSLYEGETVFWCSYFQESLRKLRTSLKARTSSSQASSSNALNNFHSLFALPVSVVTTVEASDWSVQVRLDAVTLQSKEPVCRAVMAACAANVQWSPVKDETTTIRISVRMEDTYLHVPGYHPMVDNPTFYRQRADNPQVLPSLHKHLWGRIASLGSLTLMAERGVYVVNGNQGNLVKFTNDPLTLSGEGGSLMLEWSQPTVVALARILQHIQQQYRTVPVIGDAEKVRNSKGVDGDSVGAANWTAPSVSLKIQLSDVNAFVYGLTPEAPAAMLRLDAASLSTSSLSSFSLDVHGLLLDDMHLRSFEQGFHCSNIANLPQGVGVATSTMTTIKFDNQVKNLDLNVDKVNLIWNTTAHRCLLHTTSCVLEDIKLLRGVLLQSSDSSNRNTRVSPAPTAKEIEIVPLGEIGSDFLKRIPLSFTANLEKVDCVAHMDRRAKVSLHLKTTQFGIHGNTLTGSAQEVGVKFDSHQIFTMEKFVGQFPHESEELAGERMKLEGKLERPRNPVVWVQASRAEFVFPYGYNFSLTMDKVMNVKKFLQKLHSRSNNKAVSRLLLAPDMFAECEDIVLQVPDDPFEVKLRTNYELMCDEREQKTQRLAVFNKKLKETRKEEGEIAVSGARIQSLYESLETKNSEIYCRRARNLYNSEEPLRTAVFVFSMKNTKLLAMFDPSMLGEEKLVDNLKDIDRTSSLPEQGYKFSTLWGGYVSGNTDRLQMLLRDYPQPLFDITKITIAGRMMFAEQEAQEREQRSAVVEVGHPWSNVTVKRKLPPLKYYYDFEMTSEAWDMEYGACIEPALAQTSIAFGLLTSPTTDPSRPLPYWDKLRLLFHGRIHLVTNEMRLVLPSTFNPYNTVEYLEVAMSGLDVQLLTNTCLVLEGAARMLMHTASKYDSCQFLNLPHAKATLNLNWYCRGKDPNRHHFVVRCAPDKIPIQPDKQEHDSYSTFRSQNLDVDLILDVKESDSFQPSILLYSSTLRCVQQYQNLLKWNVTRPTRRGVYFKNLKPKRPPLLRHCRELKMSVSFPKSVGRYWSSKAKQQGIHCCIDEASFSIDYRLKLVPVESNLIQRPKADWTIRSCYGEVKGITAHVERKVVEMPEDDVQLELLNGIREVNESTVLLIMDELNYSRQDSGTIEKAEEDKFIHCLETRNTRLMWNPSNRNVVLGLYDAYKQAQRLKRDLSTEALKSLLLKFESPANGENEEQDEGEEDEEAPGSLSTPILRRRQAAARMRQGSSGNTMLDQLLADISNKFVSYVDERASSDPLLKGVTAGSMNDVIKRNWLITLTNTQIALQGNEKNGYILASSHIAQVFGREHEPKLKEGDLVSKKSWVGKVQELQYFSTVGTSLDLLDELADIPWLPLSVIRPPITSGAIDSDSEEALPDEESTLNVLLSALGPDQGKEQGRPALPPGEAVGGLVSCVLVSGNQEESDKEDNVPRKIVQLQRIASRCHCQIFYVTYGEQVEEADVTKSPPSILSPRSSSGGFSSGERDTVDTFTFRYPTVDICTTSSQYAMIMDILNNLLLHKEPKKKEALDRHARMRFTLQLSNIQDPRKPIQLQQNRVRKCIHNVRELETELFLEQKSIEQNSLALTMEIDLDRELSKAKEELAIASMELRAMIRAFKENLLYMTPPRGETETEPPEPTRRIEVWVDDAHWWLTQDDGQLQVADICLTNFSYNRVSFSDDSGEHRLELGTFKVCNLMPNTPTIYQQVLIPYDPQAKHLRVDKNISLRVYCKDKARVAGISVKEHLEVNVVPLAVSLTAKFFQTVQDFFVPKAEEGVALGDTYTSGEPDHSHLFGPTGVQPSPAYGEGTDGNALPLTRGSSSRRSTMSLSSIATNTSSTTTSSLTPMLETKEPTERGKQPGSTVDDVEKMKERASHVKTFIYVKIPQTTVCITYKSENVSIKDLQNQRVTLPTLEYHNRNWTWTDLLMELKKDYKNAIVHQTLKSAIGMRDSDETAGLSSPIMKRHASDFLLGTAQQVQAKAMRGRKLFGKLVSSKDDTRSDDDSAKGESRSGKGSPVASRATYQPPLEPEINLKRTMKKLTQMTQDAQK